MTGANKCLFGGGKGQCQKHRMYAFAGEKAQFCSNHKEPGMVDVHNKRCEASDCQKHPTYGLVNGRAKFCTKHKGPDMVDVHCRPCEFAACSKHPHYAFEGDKARFCATHKETGMVDVKHKRCHTTGCRDMRVYETPIKKSRFCVFHLEEWLSSKTTRRSNEKGAGQAAGQPKHDASTAKMLTQMGGSTSSVGLSLPRDGRAEDLDMPGHKNMAGALSFLDRSPGVAGRRGSARRRPTQPSNMFGTVGSVPPTLSRSKRPSTAPPSKNHTTVRRKLNRERALSLAGPDGGSSSMGGIGDGNSSNAGTLALSPRAGGVGMSRPPPINTEEFATLADVAISAASVRQHARMARAGMMEPGEAIPSRRSGNGGGFASPASSEGHKEERRRSSDGGGFDAPGGGFRGGVMMFSPGEGGSGAGDDGAERGPPRGGGGSEGFSGRAGEFSPRGADFPQRGEEFSSRGRDFSSRSGDFCPRSGDFSPRSERLSGNLSGMFNSFSPSSRRRGRGEDDLRDAEGGLRRGGIGEGSMDGKRVPSFHGYPGDEDMGGGASANFAPPAKESSTSPRGHRRHASFDPNTDCFPQHYPLGTVGGGRGDAPSRVSHSNVYLQPLGASDTHGYVMPVGGLLRGGSFGDSFGGGQHTRRHVRGCSSGSVDLDVLAPVLAELRNSGGSSVGGTSYPSAPQPRNHDQPSSSSSQAQAHGTPPHILSDDAASATGPSPQKPSAQTLAGIGVAGSSGGVGGGGGDAVLPQGFHGESRGGGIKLEEQDSANVERTTGGREAGEFLSGRDYAQFYGVPPTTSTTSGAMAGRDEHGGSSSSASGLRWPSNSRTPGALHLEPPDASVEHLVSNMRNGVSDQNCPMEGTAEADRRAIWIRHPSGMLSGASSGASASHRQYPQPSRS